jgi:hypothetical protein
MKESRDLRGDIAGRRRRARRAQPAPRPARTGIIRKLITCLAAILDDAIEDGRIERDPARTKRMRVRVPRPQRSFLEVDLAAGLLSAATGWSRSGSSRTRGSTYAGHLSRRRASRTTLRAPVGASWDRLCTVASWAVGT